MLNDYGKNRANQNGSISKRSTPPRRRITGEINWLAMHAPAHLAFIEKRHKYRNFGWRNQLTGGRSNARAIRSRPKFINSIPEMARAAPLKSDTVRASPSHKLENRIPNRGTSDM
jgi:hypothetical protein